MSDKHSKNSSDARFHESQLIDKTDRLCAAIAPRLLPGMLLCNLVCSAIDFLYTEIPSSVWPLFLAGEKSPLIRQVAHQCPIDNRGFPSRERVNETGEQKKSLKRGGGGLKGCLKGEGLLAYAVNFSGDILSEGCKIIILSISIFKMKFTIHVVWYVVYVVLYAFGSPMQSQSARLHDFNCCILIFLQILITGLFLLADSYWLLIFWILLFFLFILSLWFLISANGNITSYYG